MEMGPPIRIINEFIYEYIIYYVTKYGRLNEEYANISHYNYIAYDKMSNSIPYYYPDEMLKTFFEEYFRINFPAKGSKQFKQEWLKKNKDIVKRYHMYVETVYSTDYKTGIRKWYDFVEMMEKNLNTKGFTPNYSLHY